LSEAQRPPSNQVEGETKPDPVADTGVQNPAKEKPEPSKNQKLLRAIRKLFGWIVLPIAWIYALEAVAAFTLVLYAIGGLQFWAFVASERASVIVNNAAFPPKALTVGLPQLPIIVELQNGGKSTATVETLTASITHGLLPATPVYGSGANFAVATFAWRKGSAHSAV
jgi:hypothetical protein